MTRVRPTAAETAERVLAVYVERPGEWLDNTTVREVLGVCRATVTHHAAALAAAGRLERSEAGSHQTRYRAPGPWAAAAPAQARLVPAVTGKPKALLQPVQTLRRRRSVEELAAEQRRERIERQILDVCADEPQRPRGVATSLVRNVVEVHGIMMNLTQRGLLESCDGYATFATAVTTRRAA